MIFSQMVDDPSAYVDVLRADPKLRRKAEAALKARLKLWQEARTLAGKAKEAGLAVPEPGPAPTLDDMLADQERQRLFQIIEKLVLWESTPMKRYCSRRATRSGRTGGGPAPRMPAIRAPPSRAPEEKPSALPMQGLELV